MSDTWTKKRLLKALDERLGASAVADAKRIPGYLSAMLVAVDVLPKGSDEDVAAYAFFRISDDPVVMIAKLLNSEEVSFDKGTGYFIFSRSESAFAVLKEISANDG